MSSHFFIPPTIIVSSLNLDNSLDIEELCSLAGVPCRATGTWTKRKIEIKLADELKIFSEPGDWGKVLIYLKKKKQFKTIEKARAALCILAYSLHDLVAKESIKQAPWSRLIPPKGRKKSLRALSNKERQRLFRKRNRTVF